MDKAYLALQDIVDPQTGQIIVERFHVLDNNEHYQWILSNLSYTKDDFVDCDKDIIGILRVSEGVYREW